MLLEFEAGFNSDVALAGRARQGRRRQARPARRRRRAERARGQSQPLPGDRRHALRRPVRARARRPSRAQAQDAIEQVPGVLSADLQGTRDEVVEIIAEPMLLKSYGVSLDQFVAAAAQGNSLVAAGALEGAAGPLRGQGAGADRNAGGRAQHPGRRLERRRRSRSATSPTIRRPSRTRPRSRGSTAGRRSPSRSSKRTGANLIETVDGVKAAIADLQKRWPRHGPGRLHPGQVEVHPAAARPTCRTA